MDKTTRSNINTLAVSFCNHCFGVYFSHEVHPCPPRVEVGDNKTATNTNKYQYWIEFKNPLKNIHIPEGGFWHVVYNSSDVELLKGGGK